MALQLCRSHRWGLRSWCWVCPLALWQPLASEMLPWTGCDIDGAERSLESSRTWNLVWVRDVEEGEVGGAEDEVRRAEAEGGEVE